MYTQNKVEVPKAFLRQRFPSIIVFNEKHGNRYYIANNPDEFGRVFLTVLEERFHQKYWYNWMKGYKDTSLVIPKFTEEDINSLPESVQEMTESMRRELSFYKKGLREQKETRENYLNIEKAIVTRDTYLAYQMIREVSSGEYEGFEIEHPLEIK